MDDTDEPWIAAIQAAPWRDWALAHPEDVAKHGYAKYL